MNPRLDVNAPRTPWTDADKAAWRAAQVRKRSYDDVVAAIEARAGDFEVVEYGTLEYGVDGTYRLLALRSRNWHPDRPIAVVTGGVHGYETSGVLGALDFAAEHALADERRCNVLIAPCVSPWAYERIHRWNPLAIDPNRSFIGNGLAEESSALLRLLAPISNNVLLHIDLHETTDSDETEFRPALAARDGVEYEPGSIPDGFYLCGDVHNPQLEFQQAVIAAVSDVTHIAPADANGEIIGTPVVAPGVILYDYRALGLCAGATAARFTTTTEVYPDSPRATPRECSAAQVRAVQSAIEFALAHAERAGQSEA